VRDHDNGDPAGSGLDDRLVDQLAAAPVEGCVRLVEQQQRAVAHHRDSEGAPSPLARRQPAVPTICDRLEAEPAQTGLGIAAAQARETGMEEQVVPHREVVVAEALVADQRDPTTYLMPGCVQAVTQDSPLARRHRQEPCEDVQEGRLAGPVGSGDQDDLTRLHLQIEAAQYRIALS
jgi:hypothetical protein